MTHTELSQGTKFIMDLFSTSHPGEIIMLNTLRYQYINNPELKDNLFGLFLNLLISNGYLLLKQNNMIELAEQGYSYIHGETNLHLHIDLFRLVPSDGDKRKFFYDIWNIIGTDKEETNPFYINGREYYDVIKQFLTGLPPSYSQYMEELKERERKNVRRSEWCKDLFFCLDGPQIQLFLDRLSSLINSRMEEGNDDITQIVEENPKETDDNMLNVARPKTPKVFISHKTEDRKYAKALVDLMLALGVKSTDIFCSSYPGFDIPLGENIFEYIKKQYKEHELFVIFIHSPRYYQSPVSLNEMGAAWILKSSHVSFLTNDCTFDMLRGVITSNEAAFKAGQADTYARLFDFKNKLKEIFRLDDINEKLWDGKKEEFLRVVNDLKYE